MDVDLTHVLAHVGRDALGQDAEFLDESAGRTVLFHGGGRVCKVFLPTDDAERRAETESAALGALAGTDVPVPAVLDRGVLPGGEPWILMAEVAGIPVPPVDFDGPDGPRFLRFQGRWAARIHAAVRPTAFGIWTTEPCTTLTDWATRCSARLERRAAAARPERAELCRSIRRAQESWLDSLLGVDPVLVHGDLTPGNFLLRDPESRASVVGVIDWETAEASTPAAEFSRAALFGGPGLAQFIGGYAETGLISDIPPERVAYFVADRVLQVFGTTGGRWNSHVDGIAERMAGRLLAGELPWPAEAANIQ
ncbi:MAG TPA: aminoglycoside phosphotransferase family protein [Mycobacteriales bacterium]|jgi:hypothetical protein|nr:aminoglycoside phosphotransferase family protein [Mycobacteriales bacterium]